MRKLGIIGLGHVGATTAFNAVVRDMADVLVLFETNLKKAAAQVQDLKDGQAAVRTSHLEIVLNDYAALSDADCVIFAAGQGDATDDGDRNSEIKTTKKAVDEVLPLLKASGFHGVLLNISNPCDVITAYWQANLGLPSNQVIGTGTSLDTNRLRRGIAEALAVPVTDVAGYTMGEHGESQFAAWSTVTLLNQDNDAVTKLDQSAIETAASQGGWTIFEGKGYTSYGIAMIAVTLACAILDNSQQIFAVSYYDPEVDAYIGHPAKLGKAGIAQALPLNLTAPERAKYQASAAVIQHNLALMNAL